MDKGIAKRLNVIANQLPTIFDWRIGYTIMKGWELKLTPLDKIQVFENEVEYKVPVPEMWAVEHKQQLKDAYKRGGIPEVKEYVKSVKDKYNDIK